MHARKRHGQDAPRGEDDTGVVDHFGNTTVKKCVARVRGDVVAGTRLRVAVFQLNIGGRWNVMHDTWPLAASN